MRKTIKNKVSVEGIGLHKGRPSRVLFLPAPEATGVRFLKPDLSEPIPANLANIAATVRGTNITDGKRTIYTVEHILSACAGLGVDDLDIAMDGEEPPAMDGSAIGFAKLLLDAGIADKPGQKKPRLELKNPAELRSGQAYYKATAATKPFFRLSFSNPHPLIGEQTIEMELTPEKYLKEVAPARTFGFKHEIDQLRAAGLALGGTLENAVVIDDNAFLSAEGKLRFETELARHKLLDLIGDLMLTGLNLDHISITASFTSHKDNVNFAKLLANTPLQA